MDWQKAFGAGKRSEVPQVPAPQLSPPPVSEQSQLVPPVSEPVESAPPNQQNENQQHDTQTILGGEHTMTELDANALNNADSDTIMAALTAEKEMELYKKLRKEKVSKWQKGLEYSLGCLIPSTLLAICVGGGAVIGWGYGSAITAAGLRNDIEGPRAAAWTTEPAKYTVRPVRDEYVVDFKGVAAPSSIDARVHAEPAESGATRLSIVVPGYVTEMNLPVEFPDAADRSTFNVLYNSPRARTVINGLEVPLYSRSKLVFGEGKVLEAELTKAASETLIKKAQTYRLGTDYTEDLADRVKQFNEVHGTKPFELEEGSDKWFIRVRYVGRK
jgi:hypothetical protein